MNFILRARLILPFCLIHFLSYSQSLLSGKVIDKENGIAIPFVNVTNNKSNYKLQSNQNGLFTLHHSGTYTFKKEGYLDYTIDIKDNSFHIIQLTINPSKLKEIIINANYLPKTLKEATSTTNILTNKNLKLANTTDISLVLNKVPGVFMQSGALNTNRISIRGIGARNLYGTAKIRAYFKDIPLTNGSGATNIEDFELESLSRLEIIKGASSLYGAGLGGSIQLTPQNSYVNQFDIENEISMGSFGLIKGITKLNYGNNKTSLNAIYSNTHSDGFRDNNTYDRQTFTININRFINKKNEISILGSYIDLKAFIPSSINEDTYKNSPKSAAFTWSNAKGFEDSKRGLLGVSWQHNYNENLKQVSSIFTSFRNAYEPRPFNILTEKTLAFGLRSRLIGHSLFLNTPISWTFGGETFKDIYKWGTFSNLYQDLPSANGSVKGDRLSNFKEKRRYFNVFIESNYSISKNTTLSLGLNYNKTAYHLEDRFKISDTNIDQSGSFNYKGILSPKIGVAHQLSQSINIYANSSHGFSPISLEETLLPDGQINTDLKPETGWNFELGTRAALLKNRLQFNAAIFRLDIKNLLVARRTSQDQFIGINAGRTQHDGLEINLNYNWLQIESLSINSFLNYTLNNFIFKDFIDDTNNYSGNDLTGVPSSIFNAGLTVNSHLGFYGNINFQYVGSMPITDSNSLYSNSYSITNLKTGYKTNLNKNLKLNTYFGLNNIFNKAYASQILINASGFGGNAPRYYYPGNPINYYTAINLNYTF
ncbi:TonB-dependent receptor [Postechiella marina]|uniref:TonB-dependent receptor n=1 Tax=Postechiella marina TaxID=943941 RepID=A0ABP8CG69_9FLAO